MDAAHCHARHCVTGGGDRATVDMVIRGGYMEERTSKNVEMVVVVLVVVWSAFAGWLFVLK